MLFTLLGMVIEVSPEQPLNAAPSILCTPSGMVMVDNPLHCEKAP